VYLFVVNLSPQPVTVRVGNLPPDASRAEVLFQDRTVEVEESTFAE